MGKKRNRADSDERISKRRASVIEGFAAGRDEYSLAVQHGVSVQTILLDMLALGMREKGKRRTDTQALKDGAARARDVLALRRRGDQSKCSICGAKADPENKLLGDIFCDDCLIHKAGKADPDYNERERAKWLSGHYGRRSALDILLTGCFILSMLIFGACEDECEALDTRCKGDTAQICSSGGDWVVFADCTDIEGGGDWVCCLDWAGDYTCNLVDECEEPAEPMKVREGK